METNSTSRLGWLRAPVLASVLMLLGGCDTLFCSLCKGGSGGGPRPSGDPTQVTAASEVTCGQKGDSARCKVKVSVWMENGKCQFSFAPEGLRLSRDLGPGNARVTFNLESLYGETFVFVDIADKPIEFRLPGPGGKPSPQPDPSASTVFRILPSSGDKRLELLSTNKPGAARTAYPYVLRVKGPNGVCVSPDPWIWPGVN